MTGSWRLFGDGPRTPASPTFWCSHSAVLLITRRRALSAFRKAISQGRVNYALSFNLAYFIYHYRVLVTRPPRHRPSSLVHKDQAHHPLPDSAPSERHHPNTCRSHIMPCLKGDLSCRSRQSSTRHQMSASQPPPAQRHRKRHHRSPRWATLAQQWQQGQREPRRQQRRHQQTRLP